MPVSPEEERHRRNLTEALAFFIDQQPNAVNGIVIGIVGDYPVTGRLLFEKAGMKTFTEAYLEQGRTRADHLPTQATR